ncbi:MAG: hypothetical protein CMF27_00780 [Kiritimatiellaceae bacterium]|jgi:hypothetical protein|nr:hypothetical protein [Kiritimatiellaceae bacterium]|tara:strand:- start:206 stop:646 length:441 start_codon:yes stop_codon:yes gene_type:complete
MSQQREHGLSEDQLLQVLHLKRYESADEGRLLRNRQNIMREVRSIQVNRRPSLLERLETHLGWFYAEPKYGLALIFLLFALLQFVGVDRTNSEASVGVYADLSGIPAEVMLEEELEVYPDLPAHIRLFASPTGGDGTVLPATFEFE